MIRRRLAAFLELGFGGGGGGVSGSLYAPTGLGAADTSWQQLLQQQIGQATGPGFSLAQSQLTPLYQQLIGNLGSQAPGIENMAQFQAAPYIANMAGQADQFHNIMAASGMQDYGMQTGLQNAGNAAWQTALDPQKALYNRTAQQVQDQSRAASSARGLGTSPYAAGLENQAMGNFNIDWQNQQLQRELSGLQGMSSADKTAGQLGAAGSQELSGSQAMSSLAPQLLMQSAQLPYQTTADLINQGFANAGTFAGAESAMLGPLSGIMSEIIPYMNYGAGAQANQFAGRQAQLGNLVGMGGLLSNEFGMGPGSGYGILSSLFGGGGAGAAGAGAAGLGGAGAAGLFGAGADAGITGMSLADLGLLAFA
jgi:hypothetical protein